MCRGRSPARLRSAICGWRPGRPDSVPPIRGSAVSRAVRRTGKTLWLIVFNRSLDSEIPAKIELEGFRYAAGSAEVLYQDDPGTVKYFEPQKEAVPGSGSSFRWKFKPHSMTAFTLTAGE